LKLNLTMYTSIGLSISMHLGETDGSKFVTSSKDLSPSDRRL